VKPGVQSTVLKKLEMVSDEIGHAQRRVADYVLSNPEEVIRMSITQLSEASEASEATVVRLMQSVGFDGYNDFKISLSRSMSHNETELERNLTPDASTADIIQNIFSMTRTGLSETFEALDSSEVEQAIDLLAAARRIEFMGVGGSAAVAHDAYHKFLRLGVPVNALMDPHDAVQVCATLGPGDVVLAISHSGRTRDILEAVRLASDQGAQVIAISRFGRSPLQRLADVTLHTLSSETAYRSEAIASRIAQLVIIDVLFVGAFFRNHPVTSANLARSRSAIQSKLV